MRKLVWYSTAIVRDSSHIEDRYSRRIRAALIALSVYYLLASLADGILLGDPMYRDPSAPGRRMFLSAFSQHGTVFLACAVALAIEAVHSKLASLVSGGSALVTGYSAAKDILAAITMGKKELALFEVVVVIPLVVIMMVCLFRRNRLYENKLDGGGD